jgi:hypothetical protein
LPDSSVDLIEKTFTKGTKTCLLATEIAQRFNGETSATELTHDERVKLSEKYGLEIEQVSNALTGLRSIGLYRDKFYRARHSSAAELPKEVIPPKTSVDPKPTEHHPDAPPTTPPLTPSETPSGASAAEPKIITTGQTASATEAATSAAEQIRSATEARLKFTEQSLEELKGLLGKQEGSINGLSGKMNEMFEYVQKASIQQPVIQMAAPQTERDEPPPQVLEFQKDMLVRKVVWFVPKVLTFYQLYVEDAQKQKDLRVPSFVEWINYMILDAYRNRQMDLALIRPPQTVKSGLFGDQS